jgi:hypothetical protein
MIQFAAVSESAVGPIADIGRFRPAIRPACYSKIGTSAPLGRDQGAIEDRVSCHDKTL